MPEPDVSMLQHAAKKMPPQVVGDENQDQDHEPQSAGPAGYLDGQEECQDGKKNVAS